MWGLFLCGKAKKSIKKARKHRTESDLIYVSRPQSTGYQILEKQSTFFKIFSLC
jgi:hypothetical protein